MTAARVLKNAAEIARIFLKRGEDSSVVGYGSRTTPTTTDLRIGWNENKRAMAVELGRRQFQERIGIGLPVSLLTTIGGLGLAGHVYWQRSVWLILAVVGGPSAAAALVGWQAISTETRRWMRHRAAVGVVAGVVGLATYDIARWLIVLGGGLSVNPFEALPVFGGLLLGEGAAGTARWVAGSVYHVVNGIGFAVFFSVLLGRRGPLAGVAWALVLEVAMLAIYPGWLDIRARTEFTLVSVSGHLAYGTAIGLVCQRQLKEEASPLQPKRGLEA